MVVSNIGSTVKCQGEARRYTILYTYINRPCRNTKQNGRLHEVNNGVLYFLDYEDKLHHGPLCSRFNVVVKSYYL